MLQRYLSLPGEKKKILAEDNLFMANFLLVRIYNLKWLSTGTRLSGYLFVSVEKIQVQAIAGRPGFVNYKGSNMLTCKVFHDLSFWLSKMIFFLW